MKMIFLTFILISFFSSSAYAQIGFYSPSGFDPDFAKNVDVSIFNLKSIDHLEEQLEIAQKNGMKVYIDIGPYINKSRSPENIKRYYLDGNEKITKELPPKTNNKLRAPPKNGVVSYLFESINGILLKYKDNIQAVFIADEPYLNGISYSELQDSARRVRTQLEKYNLESIKIGVTFASALFNSDFAKQIDEQIIIYTKGIDSYIKKLSEKTKKTSDEEFWLDNIEDIRLTTYDQAGNIYTGGGIPDEIDLVAFDFYLSTLLLDSVHENTIRWFSDNLDNESCNYFDDKKMSEIRGSLSFYQDRDDYSMKIYMEDKKILDHLFKCRIESTYTLLTNEIGKSNKNKEIILVSESSNISLIQRHADSSVKKIQHDVISKNRVIDEISRAISFYKAKVNKGNLSTLLFFVYFDEFDYSIDLEIGGIQNNEAAKALVYINADR